MRKIVAGLFITLDGVYEAPDQWQGNYFNDEMGAVVSELMAAAGTMLLGRRTYEEFAAFWPNQSAEDPIAAHMNGTPKLVASRTLRDVAWQNSTLLTGDASSELRQLKAQPGDDIGVTGSGTLVRGLLHDGVLDQLHLLVHPIVVGSGKRLFPDGTDAERLRLVDARAFSTGVVHLVYEPGQPES
jgi:dihydrofolate reductase